MASRASRNGYTKGQQGGMVWKEVVFIGRGIITVGIVATNWIWISEVLSVLWEHGRTLGSSFFSILGIVIP